MRRRVLWAQLLVSGALIFALWRSIPFAALWEGLASTRVAPLLAAVGVVLANHVALAWRTRVVTASQGFELGLLRVLQINAAGLFYKLVIPGGTLSSIGARSYKLYRAEGGLARSLWSTVFDRLLATTALLGVGLSCWLLDTEAPDRLGVWPGLVATAAVCGLLGLLLGRRFAEASLTAVRRLPLGAWGVRFERGILALEGFRELPKATLWRLGLGSLVPPVLGILIYWLLLAACGVQLGPQTLGWVRAAATLMAMLPISFGGLGVRDGVLVTLLAFYAVPAPASMAFALLVFATTVLLPAAAGGLVEAWALFGPGAAQPKRSGTD